MIVYFDGFCGLCNRFVDWALVRDTKRRFQFAPLQGKTAKANLPELLTKDLESVVVVDDQGNIHRKGRAAILVIENVSGPSRYLAMALRRILPGFILDFFYDLVAENRYRLFKKREFCRVPTAEERAHFLD